MNHKQKFGYTALGAAIIFVDLISCGDDNAAGIVGTWQGRYEGEAGLLTFANNGRASLNFKGETFHGTYRVSGDLLEINYNGRVIFVAFSINGNLMNVAWPDGARYTLILGRVL